MTRPSQTKTAITFPMDAHQRVSVSIEIEEIYNLCLETTYLEAAIIWADANNVEIEDIPKCLADALQQKIQKEALQFRLLKASTNSTCSLDSILC